MWQGCMPPKRGVGGSNPLVDGGTDASVHDGTGYKLDINDTRRHHEIYLSDARKVTPEKLKIVIRHPIRKK